MTAIRSVCVYCGSHVGRNSRHREAAVELGRLLAQHGIRLVYGGGRIGLMGEVADAVIAGGGKVVGIIPEMLETKEVGHRGISELRVVTSMHERKNLMFEMADGFVILPGGLGTLDETFEMLTWRQLRLHDKPIILVNVDGYWQPFLKLVDHVISEGFARPDSLALFTVVGAVDEIIPALERQPKPAIPSAVEKF
jgi:uncharacterized protein (TIGR00730 family)